LLPTLLNKKNSWEDPPRPYALTWRYCLVDFSVSFTVKNMYLPTTEILWRICFL